MLYFSRKMRYNRYKQSLLSSREFLEMKKRLSILVALIMAFTIFWIPGQSVFAEGEGDNGGIVQTLDNEEPTEEPPVTTHTVTFFDGLGNQIGEPQTVNDGESATAPADTPTREGFDFDGWDKDFTNVTEDLEVNAKWRPVVPTFNQGSISKNQTSVTFNWSWSNGTGTVSIYLYKSKISDRTSSYSYSKTITNAKTFTELSDGTTYNYKITATPNGGTASTYTGTVTTAAKKANGWYTVGNDKYYYRNGVKQRKTEVSIAADSTTLKHYFDCNGVFKGRRSYMYSRIKGLSSKQYLICVDRTNNVVCVYKGGKNRWYPYKYWSCVTGRTKAGNYHPTPVGTYKVRSKKTTFSGWGIPEKKKNKYSVWYCTRFTGSVFFHSQLYKYKSKSKFIPGGAAMGRNASHGCVRLRINNAKWIYKNCAKGTTVVVIQ
jgi:lipoprotein-anchoring transpeptidase ErfK/SrfK